MPTMKCFVASAFGLDDVGAIFEHAVLPIPKDLGIKPSRVERHERNDDNIFELLDAADHCIADLTYARPPVYLPPCLQNSPPDSAVGAGLLIASTWRFSVQASPSLRM
jgi:hypothetical protein